MGTDAETSQGCRVACTMKTHTLRHRASVSGKMVMQSRRKRRFMWSSLPSSLTSHGLLVITSTRAGVPLEEEELFRIVYAQGAIPNEVGPTRCQKRRSRGEEEGELRCSGRDGRMAGWLYFTFHVAIKSGGPRASSLEVIKGSRVGCGCLWPIATSTAADPPALLSSYSALRSPRSA